jgi:hypothetical protein
MKPNVQKTAQKYGKPFFINKSWNLQFCNHQRVSVPKLLKSLYPTVQYCFQAGFVTYYCCIDDVVKSCNGLVVVWYCVLMVSLN